MYSNNVNTLALGLVASLIAPASAFWRMSCPGRLVDERADPIISPGAVSGHVHTIAGGNGFGFQMTYDQARASQCSSCPIKEDLSNYWTPKLYYKGKNGTFTSVPQIGDGGGKLGGMTVYYQQRPGPDNDKLQAFPKGFRMVAGDPYKRNYTGDFAAKAVSYACLNYNGPATPETNSFPTVNCPNGVRAQVYFPSCWDGKNLDSPDHKSHMSYPKDGDYNGGRCPSTHPVHLISIFYEVIWQTNLFANQWYDGKQPFVWANGDPTGYGFHGDFVNGWDVDVLQKATTNCNDNSGDTHACPYFTFFDDNQCAACMLGSSVNEQVSGLLPALPGCNPVQPGPGYATKPAGCTDNATIGAPQTFFTDLTKSKSWAYLGCGKDSVSSRTFSAKSTNQKSMTPAACVDFCSAAGYTYAGVEYSTECYCSNAAPAADRAPQPGVMGNCLMPCGGDANQYCGGGSAIGIYQKCAGGSCVNKASKKVKRRGRHLGGHVRKVGGGSAHVL